MNRHLSRIIAMQSLYEWEFRNGSNVEEITDRNIDEYSDKCEPEFVKKLVDGIAPIVDKIDEEIVISAPEWPLDQISLLDKAILRLAVFELLHLREVPSKVVINEAIELAKEFGGENSSKFVNGVLGSVYKKHEKEVLA